MNVPQPSDVRALLEGFGLDVPTFISITGTWALAGQQVTGANTTVIRVGDLVAGSGFPVGSRVESIDVVHLTAGVFTADHNFTAGATGGAITVTQYPPPSDGWLTRRRDSLVAPWIEAKCRTSLSSVKEATEYYDGTGSSLMILRRRPIVQLLAISYTNVDSNLYYLTPSAIQVIADEGILKAKANFNESTYIPIFYRGTKNVRIKYQYGSNDWPDWASEAGAMLLAEQALAFVGSQTGGGDLTTQGYSRSFGKSGKYTHMRRQLARDAIALLRPYMTAGGAT